MTDMQVNESEGKLVVEKHEYAVVNTSPQEIKSILQENTGGELSPFDLDQIKVPSGGGTHFLVPTLEGEVPANEIEGVIVHFTKPRVFWKEPFGSGGGTTPPDCSSIDGITGIGSPGGSCAECPMSKFGTATNQDGSLGAGQACSQKNNLFVLRQNDILPIVVVGPPTSLKNIRQYLLRLANDRSTYYSVITKLKLTKAVSKGGVDYAQIELSFSGRLDDAATAAMDAYHQEIAPILDGVHFDPVA